MKTSSSSRLRKIPLNYSSCRNDSHPLMLDGCIEQLQFLRISPKEWIPLHSDQCKRIKLGPIHPSFPSNNIVNIKPLDLGPSSIESVSSSYGSLNDNFCNVSQNVLCGENNTILSMMSQNSTSVPL